MADDKNKYTCGECEFYGKRDLCPCPKDCPWLRRASAKQCRPYWLLVKTRQELDEVRFEVSRWQRWAAKIDCTNPKWPPVSGTTESNDCGECVPCKARAALEGNNP